MNIKNRLAILEKEVKSQVGEALVAITAKTTEKFEEKVSEYLKTNPEPELFVHIVDFF